MFNSFHRSLSHCSGYLRAPCLHLTLFTFLPLCLLEYAGGCWRIIGRFCIYFVLQTVKSLPAMQNEVRSLDQEDPLEKGMEAHSSIRAWETP